MELLSSPPKVGESFNPSRHVCGFYPPDVVGRQRVLNSSAKRLYERLVRFAGRDGLCFPSQATLGTELGESDRQVRKSLRKLENLGLIRHEFRNGRRSNTYIFLWHEIFERNAVSGQVTQSDDLTGTNVPDDANVDRNKRIDLTGTYVPPNSVHEFDGLRQHHRSAARDDVAPLSDYEIAIQEALLARKCWGPRALSASDRRIARGWQSEGVSIEKAKAAIVTGCARKIVSALNRHSDPRISSLGYFNAILGEEISQDQVLHLERRLTQMESSICARTAVAS
jgi:hypothetical protein